MQFLRGEKVNFVCDCARIEWCILLCEELASRKMTGLVNLLV